MTDHQTRPRFGRLAAAFSALMVTMVTMLGGMGVLPVGASSAAASGSAPKTHSSGESAALAGAKLPDKSPTKPTDDIPDTAVNGPAPPDQSGEGKRVVFDMSDQRVWLVDGDDEVVRTYLVSGSLIDNLDPGSYEVYSHSRWAVGIDDSGTMEYFTRFAHGANAAIGFHSIPTKSGKALQTREQLGTPQSHGCIRQWLPDAKTLYRFAPVGTKVVVTA